MRTVMLAHLAILCTAALLATGCTWERRLDRPGAADLAPADFGVDRYLSGDGLSPGLFGDLCLGAGDCTSGRCIKGRCGSTASKLVVEYDSPYGVNTESLSVNGKFLPADQWKDGWCTAKNASRIVCNVTIPAGATELVLSVKSILGSQHTNGSSMFSCGEETPCSAGSYFPIGQLKVSLAGSRLHGEIAPNPPAHGGCNHKFVLSSRARCADEVVNGDETDTDCGGTTCKRCALDKVCKRHWDCESWYCHKGRCKAETCLETIRQGKVSCVEPSGRVLYRTDKYCLDKALLTDARIKTEDWSVYVWFEAQPPPAYGYHVKLPMRVLEPGISYIQMPSDLLPGLCPQSNGTMKHPYRLGAPQLKINGKDRYAGGSQNPYAYAKGMVAVLPIQTGEQYPYFQVAVGRWPSPAAWGPVAAAAHADMYGAKKHCSP